MAEINPDTYQAFLEVLAKAPCATTYKCRDLERGIARELSGEKFDQLPWDGEVDDIVSATWSLPGEFAAIMGLDFNQAGQVSLSITHDGGIYVANPYGQWRTHAVGLAGVMPGNRPRLDLNNPNALNRVTVNSHEAMVAKVLELLVAGDWQSADEIVAREHAAYGGW